jgi:TolA-binding protein
MKKEKIKDVVKIVFLCTVLAIAPLSLSAMTREMELFSDAESRYYGKSYAIALEMYDEFLKKFPLSDLVPDAQYRKAVCLYRLGDLEGAMALFSTVEKRYRVTKYITYIPFWKGLIYFHRADYKNAEALLEAFAQETKDKDLGQQAMLYLAVSELSQEKYEQAYETMKRLEDAKRPDTFSPYEALVFSHVLLKKNAYSELVSFQEGVDYTEFSEAWSERMRLYKGEALWNLQEVKRAEEVYRSLVDAHPDVSAGAFRRLYLIAQQNNDIERMEEIILQAEEKFSGSRETLVDLWLGIGIESFNRGEMDLARYFLNKIWITREQQEVSEAVPVYLAEIHILEGEAESAKRVLEEYIKRYKREPAVVLLRLGNIYMYGREFEKASEMFSRVGALYPDTVHAQKALYLLAYARYRMGQYAESLALCLEMTERENIEAQLKPGILRLTALNYRRLGKIEDAARTMEVYLVFYPLDLSAHVDLTKLLFSSGKYKDAISRADGTLQGWPSMQQTEISAYLLLKYIQGLSYIRLKSYADAHTAFQEITSGRVQDAGLEEIFPYVEYYRGWILYRLNDVESAEDVFERFVRSFRDHELFAQALFMSAWCAYSLGNYEESNKLFARLADDESGPYGDKAHFLRAKSLESLKRSSESEILFQNLYEESPNSPFADDALYEHANLLGEKGAIDAAAEKYLELHSRYTASPLADEALYRRGELYFNSGNFEKARDSFREYRVHYPKGTLIDASLYWEGLSAYNDGDREEALRLWETLIESHEASPFRPDALMKITDARIENGDYRDALESVNELLQEYPEYSERVNAKLTAEQVRYLIRGMSPAEAELTARISTQGGVQSRQGREAMVELSRFYIFEDEDNIERAFQMLSQVVEYKRDSVTAAKAQFLLGEYYEKKGMYTEAGKEFFKASLKDTEDADFRAYSIYRAALSMKRVGKSREIGELVSRLEKNYPQSEWTQKGKKLLEEE